MIELKSLAMTGVSPQDVVSENPWGRGGREGPNNVRGVSSNSDAGRAKQRKFSQVLITKLVEFCTNKRKAHT